MGKRTPKEEKGGKSSNLDPETDRSGDSNLESDFAREVIDTEPDEFAELFDGADDGGNVIVELYRKAPAFFNGQPITGFVSSLEPGTTIQMIKNAYGGGRYLIKKRIDGQWAGQWRLVISGPPKLESLPPVGSPAGPTPAPDLEPVSINGVPVGGSDEQFIKMMQRIAMIKAAFPPPPDINATLVSHLLNNSSNQAKMSDNIEMINAIVDLGEKLGARGSDTPTDILGLAGKAIDAFGKIVDARSGATRPVPGTYTGKRPLPAPVVPGIAPVKAIGTDLNPENEVKPEAETTKEEQEAMNPKQLAAIAITNIIASYITDPPLSVDETVEMLNFTLDGITPEIKQQIGGFKTILRNMAIVQFNDQFDQVPNPEDRKKFLLFFDEVFIKFIS